MGSWINFHQNPASRIYNPAIGESGLGTAGWADEMAETLQAIADHDHSPVYGGQALGFHGDPPPIITNHITEQEAHRGSVGLPAQGDHTHGHGSLSGTSLHPDYSLTTHAHALDYAALIHTHGAGSGSDWTVNTDATYGDYLTANITDPVGTGTQVTVREHPTGVLMIRQGASGDAATNIDLLGPTLVFVQDNAAPDGTSPDMILNGTLLFTAHGAGERLMGDIGIGYPDFPWHPGDGAIFSVRRQPTLGPWTGTGDMGWRLGQHRHNDEADYNNPSYTRSRLARFVFALHPDWPDAAADAIQWQADLDEDGNFWARGDSEFGGHTHWLGTNNVNGDSQGNWEDTVLVPSYGANLARIRHTLLNIMAAPPGNDANGTGAGIVFYPWITPTNRGGNNPSSSAWLSAVKTAAGNIANTFGIVYDHSVREDEIRSTYHNAAHPGLIIYGTNEPAASPYGAIISAFSLYRDAAGNQVDYAGLLYTFGAKHTDVRVHGTLDREPLIMIAAGDAWGGGNRLGRLVFANTEFGFGYESDRYLEIAQFANVTTAPGYNAKWGMGSRNGYTFRLKTEAGDQTLMAFGSADFNSNSKHAEIGIFARTWHVGQVVIDCTENAGSLWLRMGANAYYKLAVGSSLGGGANVAWLMGPFTAPDTY